METITFYSYKGGTGRTLLVAHAARYLALVGKRVVAIDLDLEAPGLHYRLNIGAPGERTADAVPERGVVDYLHDSIKAGRAPEAPLRTYMRPVAMPNGSTGRLWLMPAGPAPSGAYWKQLTALLRMDPFLDAKGLALAAILDLMARIEEDLQPDYLLIDSRTGITELGGIATSVLADKVVCLFTDNRESLDGARAVMRSLHHTVRHSGRGPVEVIPVLSRVSEPSDRQKAGTLQLLNSSTSEGDEEKLFDRLFFLRTDPRADDIGDWDERIRSAARTRRSAKADPRGWQGVYRDYRLLISVLAPAHPDAANRAWSRHEATQEMLKWLTEKPLWFGRYPFRRDQIGEGVSLGESTGNFADLVAFSAQDGKEPLLAAVYVEGDLAASTAWRAWEREPHLRCVILFNKAGERLQGRIFTRTEASQDLRENGPLEGQ